MIQLGQAIDIFLQPSEFYFGEADTRIRTTLGSCVAMSFWHPQRKIGGMCHYMLPSRGSRDADGPRGRYGDEAMQLFLEEIRRSGTRPNDYEVKLFGGANMFPQYRALKADEGVPAKNIAKAKELVLRHGLKVKSQSLGGVGYRQVFFEVWSGDVWVRQDARAAAVGESRA